MWGRATGVKGLRGIATFGVVAQLLACSEAADSDTGKHAANDAGGDSQATSDATDRPTAELTAAEGSAPAVTPSNDLEPTSASALDDTDVATASPTQGPSNATSTPSEAPGTEPTEGVDNSAIEVTDGTSAVDSNPSIDDGAGGAGSSDAGPSDGSNETTEAIDVNLEDCMMGTPQQQPDQICSLDLSCGEHGHGGVTCTEVVGGYSCGCSFDDGSLRALTVSTAAGEQTCSLMAEVCLAGTPISFAGDYECGDVTSSNEESVCNKSHECSRKDVLSNGLVVLDPYTEAVVCFGDGTCACDSLLLGQPEFEFADATIPDVCDAAFDVCTGGVVADPEVEPQCEVSEDDVGTLDSCNIVQRCEHALPGGEGVLRTALSTNCRQVDDVSSCRCYDGGRSVSFSQPGVANDVSTCNGAQDLCEDAFAAEMTAPPTCLLNNDQRGTDGCRLSYVCNQTGLVGDLEVKRVADVNVTCDVPSPDQPQWRCWCSTTNGPSGPEMVLPNPDAFDGCEQLMPQCQAALDVLAVTGGH